MAIKFNKIKPGMELCDVHSHRMGNTTMRELGLWYVHVVSVDPETETAIVRWNGNAPQKWYRRQLEQLYIKPPPKYEAQQAARRARGGRLI